MNVRVTDLVGAWHHLTFPIDELSEGSFEDGFGFDGCLCGLGFYPESDRLLVLTRRVTDRCLHGRERCLIADVIDPITKEGYARSRGVGRRAESI